MSVSLKSDTCMSDRGSRETKKPRSIGLESIRRGIGRILIWHVHRKHRLGFALCDAPFLFVSLAYSSSKTDALHRSNCRPDGTSRACLVSRREMETLGKRKTFTRASARCTERAVRRDGNGRHEAMKQCISVTLKSIEK